MLLFIVRHHFLDHWEISGEKCDARMVKAYLDSPEVIFLMGKGYSRNSIKVAVTMLLLSNKGDLLESF